MVFDLDSNVHQAVRIKPYRPPPARKDLSRNDILMELLCVLSHQSKASTRTTAAEVIAPLRKRLCMHNAVPGMISPRSK